MPVAPPDSDRRDSQRSAGPGWVTGRIATVVTSLILGFVGGGLAAGFVVGGLPAGSLAEWVAAVGTAGAVLASAFLLRHEIQGRRDDERERAALRTTEFAEAKRRQASALSAWALATAPPREHDENGNRVQMGGNASVRVAVRNGSDEPAYNVRAYVRFHYGEDAGSMGSHPHLVPPASTIEFWVDGIELPEGGLAYLPHIELVFTDARGTHWARLHNGRLHEVAEGTRWSHLLED
ncbi:MAG: hypothetical protein QOG87_428 [Actinomycetota bacterium]|jgi:hypothetical protein